MPVDLSGLGLKKKSSSSGTKKKFEPDAPIDYRKYAAMAVRGVSGLAPPGWIGAAAGGAGELGAELIEGRPEINWPQVGVQSALNAIPFGTTSKIGTAMLRGGLMGGGGAAVTQQAEKGLHVPDSGEFKDIALGTGIGAGTAGILHSIAGKLKPKVSVDSEVKIPKSETTPSVIETPKITTEVTSPIAPSTVTPTGTPQLPHELRGAKPKFKEYEPQFDNDIDKAFYIVGNVSNKSKRDEEYMQFLRQVTKLPDQDIRGLGLKTRLKIKDILANVKESSGAVDIPQLHDLQNLQPLAPRATRIRTSDPAEGKKILNQLAVDLPEEPTPQVSLGGGGNGNVPPTNPPKSGGMFSWLPRDEKTGNIKFSEILNAPKALSASMDLSAPLRQGLFLMGREAWWKSLEPMLKSIKTSNYEDSFAALQAHPKFQEAVKNGVVFADKIGEGEEQFGSKLAAKFPGLGKYLVAPSERAYTTFINHLRMGVYDTLTDSADKLFAKNQALGKEMMPINKQNIANYVNTASGRGTMGVTIGSKSEAGERAANFLNNVFFSPRFIASRVQLLNPYSYVKLDPFTRMAALRDLATLTTVTGTTLFLAALNGADVTVDPRSTDFGKIKIGDTRVDPLGGFGQYIRFFAQTAQGLTHDGEGAPDPLKFVESKLSPAARMAKELTSGKDYFGKKISPPQSVLGAFMPMVAQDIYQLYKEDPSLLPLAGASFVGIPTQTYGTTPKRRSSTRLPSVKLPRLTQ